MIWGNCDSLHEELWLGQGSKLHKALISELIWTSPKTQNQNLWVRETHTKHASKPQALTFSLETSSTDACRFQEVEGCGSRLPRRNWSWKNQRNVNFVSVA